MPAASSPALFRGPPELTAAGSWRPAFADGFGGPAEASREGWLSPESWIGLDSGLAVTRGLGEAGFWPLLRHTVNGDVHLLVVETDEARHLRGRQQRCAVAPGNIFGGYFPGG